MPLRSFRGGLWLLGARILAFLQRRSGPNSVGGCCLYGIAAVVVWPPVTGWEGRLRVGISATLCWPSPWCVAVMAFLRRQHGTKTGGGVTAMAFLRHQSGPL